MHLSLGRVTIFALLVAAAWISGCHSKDAPTTDDAASRREQAETALRHFLDVAIVPRTASDPLLVAAARAADGRTSPATPARRTEPREPSRTAPEPIPADVVGQDPYVVAARRLAEFGSDGINVLRRELDRRDPTTFEHALVGLTYFNDPAASEVVRGLENFESMSDSARMFIVQIVGNDPSRSEASVRFAVLSARDPSRTVRFMAIRGMELLGWRHRGLVDAEIRRLAEEDLDPSCREDAQRLASSWGISIRESDGIGDSDEK